MISSIIKKATAIYRLSSLILLCIISQSFAAEDLASFCFNTSTNLKEASDSLSFLLIPKEKIFIRSKDHCFDVLTSTDRTKLLDKFLHKRYNLLSDSNASIIEKVPETLQMQHCQLELITKRKKEATTSEFKIGTQNNASGTANSVQEYTNAQILLGIGKPGTLELEGKSLYVECTKGAAGSFNLVFSYSEMYRAKVTSVVSLKENETLQIAQITNDLNQKSKTLGLPESLYTDTEGQENISYELKVR
jgi:hypothetical protein